MKKNVLMLAAILALMTGLVFAQNSSSQDRSSDQQTPQSQQAPEPSQPTQSQSASGGQDAQSQIQSALQQQPGLSSVMVNSSGKNIELTGTVETKADKEKARNIAESAAGGRKVVNKIKVSGGSNMSPTQRPPQ